MDPIERFRFRPRLDRLEDRAMPAVVATAPQVRVETPTINDKIVAYLAAHLGKRVGGGECAHASTEALRAAGARFIRGADFPGNGDYVWGRLVRAITPGDSAPGVACKPGDIIQYRNATFSNGMWATHHTSIVAAVDSQGRPTSVYEQNFNGQRVVRLNSINVGQLTAGWLRVYRGEPRVTVRGRTEFTLVNNLRAARGGAMRVGTFNLGRFTLGPANTMSSYQTRYVTATPGLPVRITVGLTTVNVVNGGAYELFLRAGRLSIRRIG